LEISYLKRILKKKRKNWCRKLKQKIMQKTEAKIDSENWSKNWCKKWSKSWCRKLKQKLMQKVKEIFILSTKTSSKINIFSASSTCSRLSELVSLFMHVCFFILFLLLGADIFWRAFCTIKFKRHLLMMSNIYGWRKG